MQKSFALIAVLFLTITCLQGQPKIATVIYQVPNYGEVDRKPDPATEFKANGTIYHRINDTLYAAITEVTNKDYNQFLSILLPYEQEVCKIDSSQWIKKFEDSYNDPMAAHYHTHTAFNYFPVVNIAHAGAVKYCEWLTKKYRVGHKKPLVTFRLPTEPEWLALCQANATGLPNNMQNGKRNDSTYAANFKPVINNEGVWPADGGFYTLRVNGYWPDDNGLFNVIGNAAEMTNLPGVSKGGSWFDIIEECVASKKQTYSAPDPRVGFRVIAVVAERNK